MEEEIYELIIQTEINNDDIVYLKTDTEHKPRVVTCIHIESTGGISYTLNSGTESSTHSIGEIDKETDLIEVNLN